MGEPATMPSARMSQPSTFPRNTFGTSVSPTTSFRTDMFSSGMNGNASAQAFNRPSQYHERHGSLTMPTLGNLNLSDPSAFESRPAPAIIIRKLAPRTSIETVSSMLIFAGDFIDAELVRTMYPDDQGYVTAVARFHSQAGALEAQQKLHGKPNITKDANMVVEVHSTGMGGPFDRRNTVDGGRSHTSSASSAGSVNGGRSRFNSTFQANEKNSPPLTSVNSNEFPVPDTSPKFQSLFSAQPQHSLTNGFNHSSGKSMINGDLVDDETSELLNDPVAFSRLGSQSQARRPTNPQIPISRFGSLSVSTGNTNGNVNGLASPLTNEGRNSIAGQGPMSARSPSSGQNGMYNAQYSRPQYPPVNPADQNPPCNTLYVGNLPAGSNEDELKALFSKQRGYKRMCYRVKGNGPMCFVEFEDVTFATVALNDLYGHLLSNSHKGGIRLSYSKNPLGVRSGQTNGIPQNVGMAPPVMNSGYSMHGGGGGSFSAVSGPPPGLGGPGGLSNGRGQRPPPGMDGQFNQGFGMPADMGQMSPRAMTASNGMNGYAREMRGSYNDFTLGR